MSGQMVANLWHPASVFSCHVLVFTVTLTNTLEKGELRTHVCATINVRCYKIHYVYCIVLYIVVTCLCLQWPIYWYFMFAL